MDQATWIRTDFTHSDPLILKHILKIYCIEIAYTEALCVFVFVREKEKHRTDGLEAEANAKQVWGTEYIESFLKGEDIHSSQLVSLPIEWHGINLQVDVACFSAAHPADGSAVKRGS